ncbi:CidA/LrgA family protein [Fusobacterium sp.]|uniref:CidA/LrgA family protein n=1 Tax=Fusobacterium sp. TaxID=68766 RepID=UPI00261F2CE5|nr:CidA/LrgA family protein [Fusobacterium sp.]
MFIQLLILLSINFLGILIQKTFNLPLPGTIIGMLILFILLYKKILTEKTIGNVCDFFIKIMVLLFLPPIVDLIENFDLLRVGFLKIIFLLVVTTAITMVVTGKTVEYLIRMKEGKR